MSILEVKGVKNVYTTRFGNNKVEALKNVNFQVEKGEYVAIMGESGSGKTTLLNILAALDRPTGGSVLLDGRNLSDIKESDMAAFRRDEPGFVFQDFNLLDTFPVEDNIYLPLVLAGKSYNEMLISLLKLGVWVIIIFSVLLLSYTNSFLRKKRTREFGLYNILGMDKRNIGLILFFETMIMAFLSLLFCPCFSVCLRAFSS